MSSRLLKPHLEGNVEFEYYRDGSLWYRTKYGFLFPVPIDDIGTATFLRTDKAILFMRYIRKWMETMSGERDDPFEVDKDE